MSGDVSDNEAERRYELRAGNEVAFLQYYDKHGGERVLVHTEVPPALAGRGLGSRLVKGALDDAQAHGKRIVPLCPFVQAYLKRHPEYSSLITGE